MFPRDQKMLRGMNGREGATCCGAHHGVGAHARRRHGCILRACSRLAHESLLIGLDGGVDVHGGVGGLRLRHIGPPRHGIGSGRAGMEAGEGRGWVATRGDAKGLPRSGGRDVCHCGGWMVEDQVGGVAAQAFAAVHDRFGWQLCLTKRAAAGRGHQPLHHSE